MAIQVTAELQRMLEEAARREASDLHLVPGEPPVYRIQGRLVRAEQGPLSEEDVRHIIDAAIGAEQAGRIGPEREVAITTCGIEGLVEGRMCVTRHMERLTAAVRLLPGRLPDATKARVPQALLDLVDSRPHGLVLVTGLTGSGKNTVALLLLDHINGRRAAHIVTIEDPVAMHLPPKQALIRQQSVGTDTPSFHGALRAVLRLDPDVIYVSEIRDLVTLQACVTAAQTGHLVISVIHGPSPEAALRLMLDAQPEEMRPIFRRSLAGALGAVVMTHLLPEASGPGRVAAYGVLLPDEAMRQAIAEGRDLAKRPTLSPEGQTIAQDIERLVVEGRVTREAAREAMEKIWQG